VDETWQWMVSVALDENEDDIDEVNGCIVPVAVEDADVVRDDDVNAVAEGMMKDVVDESHRGVHYWVAYREDWRWAE